MRCGHALGAPDLIPIMSYLALRGRCRYCGVRISPQYPLVEAAAGALALGTWFVYPEPAAFFLAYTVHLTLLFIFVYDLRHQIIPVPALALLLLFAGAYLSYAAPVPHNLFAGVALAAPLLMLALVSRGRWMGFGDAPLMLALGSFLGLSAGLTAFMLAFWLGACVGIVLLVVHKGYRMKSEVPLAPFLIVGAWATHFFHVDFFPNLPDLLPYLIP